jgi:hypothetical protein
MRKAAIIMLAASPFIAVGAGIVAARVAPALMHHAAQNETNKESDNGGAKSRPSAQKVG